MSGWQEKILHIVLNTALFVGLMAVSYSWMLTSPSSSENIDYDKTFIINSADVTVVPYVFEDGAYVQEDGFSLLNGPFEPGRLFKYRFDIINSNDLDAKVKISFSDITGDIVDLAPYFKFGSYSHYY